MLVGEILLQVAKNQWLCFFPDLGTIQSPALNKMVDSVLHVNLKVGQMVFRDGESCQNYLMVLSGVVRVQKNTEDGHVITLYRLHTGEACEITTTCLLADDIYHAEAVAESDVNAILIPKKDFKSALIESPEFRTYVFKMIEDGVNVLLKIIENVAFVPMDVRIANNLIENANDQYKVMTTHYKIASNLGSSREVVSRILKKFEKINLVKLHRGRIIILNYPEVNRLAKNTY